MADILSQNEIDALLSGSGILRTDLGRVGARTSILITGKKGFMDRMPAQLKNKLNALLKSAGVDGAKISIFTALGCIYATTGRGGTTTGRGSIFFLL